MLFECKWSIYILLNAIRCQSKLPLILYIAKSDFYFFKWCRETLLNFSQYGKTSIFIIKQNIWVSWLFYQYLIHVKIFTDWSHLSLILCVLYNYISFSETGTMKDFRLYVSNTTIHGPDETLCYTNLGQTSNPETTQDIICNLLARKLYFFNRYKVVELCYVEIHGKKN